MTGKPHRCDERCVCPEHGTQLIYWPAGDDHACQEKFCRYAHGMNELLVAEAVGQYLRADRRWEDYVDEEGYG